MTYSVVDISAKIRKFLGSFIKFCISFDVAWHDRIFPSNSSMDDDIANNSWNARSWTGDIIFCLTSSVLGTYSFYTFMGGSGVLKSPLSSENSLELIPLILLRTSLSLDLSSWLELLIWFTFINLSFPSYSFWKSHFALNLNVGELLSF